MTESVLSDASRRSEGARDVGTYGFVGGEARVARVPPGFRPITHWDHVAHPQYYYVLARKLETEELAWFTPERLDELYARFCDAEAKGRGHRPRPFPDPADVARIAPKLPGRNDACWCGSAKKFKKCHGDARA